MGIECPFCGEFISEKDLNDEYCPHCLKDIDIEDIGNENEEENENDHLDLDEDYF